MQDWEKKTESKGFFYTLYKEIIADKEKMFIAGLLIGIALVSCGQ